MCQWLNTWISLWFWQALNERQKHVQLPLWHEMRESFCVGIHWIPPGTIKCRRPGYNELQRWWPIELLSVEGASWVMWGRRFGTSRRQMLEWILQVVLCSFMVGSLADLSFGSLSSVQAGGDTISLLIMTLLILP